MVKSEAKQLLRLFGACYIIHCFSYVYFVFGPFYEALGASPKATGWFFSVFFATMTLCRPVGGMALERFGIKNTLVAASALCAVGGAGIAVSLGSLPLILLFRAMSGVGFGTFVVALLAYQSIVVLPEKRGAAFALVTTGSMAPLATVIPIAEFLLFAGYPGLYIWSAPVVAVACIVMGMHVEAPSQTPPPPPQWGRYRDLVKIEGFGTLLVSTLCMAMMDAMTLCVASLGSERGVSASSFMAATAIGAVLIRTLGFRLMDYVSRYLMLTPSIALMAVSLVAISFGSGNMSFMIGGFAFGVGIGVAYPTSVSLMGDITPTSLHPKGTAMLMLSIDVGWALMPLIYGYISPLTGQSDAFRVTGTVGAVVAALTLWRLWVPLYKKKCRSQTI